MVVILFSREKVPQNVSKNKLVHENPSIGLTRSGLWASGLLLVNEILSQQQKTLIRK